MRIYTTSCLLLLVFCAALSGCVPATLEDAVTAVQNIPGGPIALPQPAYTGSSGSCVAALVVLGEVSGSRQGDPLELSCYRVTATGQAAGQIMGDVAAALERAGYELADELSDEAMVNQLWFSGAEHASVDLTYWRRYRGGVLASLVVHAARE